MKRIALKLKLLGFIALAVTACGLAMPANSAKNQGIFQRQTPSPTATIAGNPLMDHGNMGSMNHTMGMDLGPGDAEFDLRFIDAMIPHHQGGVEMAIQAQQKSRRPEILKLAAAIIKAQDKEIVQMQRWRQAWYSTVSSIPIAYNAQMGHAMPMSQEQRASMMMTMDLGAADAEFDLRFMDAMIPHHEGAVVMAKDALQKSKRPEIQTLARDIIRSQTTEINQMKQWQQAWYKQ
ncbi:hypothetical protein DO97_06990 [Neosynechococcus sphagnicola sy1]|uniref:DUF305 domain-containing protein n=1 Tax=Neosynechococcus sphagnicola sy1 TaxID=1497020 RepID=A0A098TLB1_9CYAN|nr:DUF305 domain-containing protein [Neosynechococcus sphagnicola]KGF72662.1 hypothetical protein DO97_06990 [Neosynechococcus sphagnicola sy1]